MQQLVEEERRKAGSTAGGGVDTGSTQGMGQLKEEKQGLEGQWVQHLLVPIFLPPAATECQLRGGEVALSSCRQEGDRYK